MVTPIEHCYYHILGALEGHPIADLHCRKRYRGAPISADKIRYIKQFWADMAKFGQHALLLRQWQNTMKREVQARLVLVVKIPLQLMWTLWVHKGSNIK